VLEDREVSREHIKVVRRGFAVFLFDAASTRGSWLGRSTVYQGSRVEWQRPRMLKLGATVLSLELPDEARARAPVQVSAPMTPPPRQRGAVETVLAAQQQASRPSRAATSSNAPTPEPGAPPNVPVYHYQAKPQPPPEPAPTPSPMSPPFTSTAPMGVPAAMTATAPPIVPSVPPPSLQQGSRKAWKTTGPTIGRASGLFLLALAGLAILGVIFVVFTLME
jgi:hypothetical protein